MKLFSRKMDWFLIGMLAAVLLAWLFPSPGAEGGWLHPELLTKLGVALVFFLHGIGLSFQAMQAGIRLWKLHLLVQGTTFLLFPLIGWLIMQGGAGFLPENLGLGFFFLCALPSTVSSSVAMTAAAGGNVAAAIFNATLSSLLGILLTPLWIGLVASSQSAMGDLGHVFLDLLLWLFLPLVLGQMARPWLGAWIGRHKKAVHIIDRGTILLLVYTSFCDSMRWDVWGGHGWQAPILALVGSILLLMLVLWLTGFVSRRFGFTNPDRITTIFCASKKSLAQGVPMARLIFGANPALGMILLPILIYHPLQLFICGILASKWKKQSLA